MSISLDQNEIEAGLPVLINVKVKNVSVETLRLEETSPEADFSFQVRDKDGKQADELRYLKRLGESQDVYRRIFLPVAPGEQVEYRFNLSRLFDLSLLGAYTVRANRSVFGLKGEGTAPLTSNVETLVIRSPAIPRGRLVPAK